jgi:hypothetical protein
LSPIRSLNGFFDFQIEFTGSGEVGDKIPYARHSTGWEGWPGVTVFGRPGHKTADRYEKADFMTFALLGQKNIFSIITQPHTYNGAELQRQFGLNLNSLRIFGVSRPDKQT